MRACTNCGDWVGDANTSCPKCGSTFATAPAPAARPEWAPPAPTPQQYAPWQQPKRRRSPITRVILWTVGVVGGLLVVAIGVGVYQAIVNGTPPGLDGYMQHGQGVSYTPAGSHFVARFPVDPVARNQSVPVAGRNIQLYAADASRKTYSFIAAEYLIPPELLPNYDFDRGTSGAATGSARGAGVESPPAPTKMTTVQGWPGYVLHGKNTSGDVVYVEAFYTGGRVYMLAVDTHYGSPEALKAFEKSFRLR